MTDLQLSEMSPETPGAIEKFAMVGVATVEAVAARFGAGATGGSMLVHDNAPCVLLDKLVGKITGDMAVDSRQRCREQALRLLGCPQHQTSFQSRHPDTKMLGGAIRLPSEFIVSFYGFPELVNEAYIASLARFMGWMGDEEIRGRLAHSNNFNLFEKVHCLVVETTMP